jgi:hypothetical protein
LYSELSETSSFLILKQLITDANSTTSSKGAYKIELKILKSVYEISPPVELIVSISLITELTIPDDILLISE